MRTNLTYLRKGRAWARSFLIDIFNLFLLFLLLFIRGYE